MSVVTDEMAPAGPCGTARPDQRWLQDTALQTGPFRCACSASRPASARAVGAALRECVPSRADRGRAVRPGQERACVCLPAHPAAHREPPGARRPRPVPARIVKRLLKMTLSTSSERLTSSTPAGLLITCVYRRRWAARAGLLLARARGNSSSFQHGAGKPHAAGTGAPPGLFPALFAPSLS